MHYTVTMLETIDRVTQQKSYRAHEKEIRHIASSTKIPKVKYTNWSEEA